MSRYQVDSDDSDSDDEAVYGFIDNLTRPRRVRVYRTRENQFNKWDEEEFLNRFRLSKCTVVMLLDKIRPQIEWPTSRNKALKSHEMLLLTLRFMATNSFLITSGDFINIHKTTAGKHIYRVMKAIANLRQEYIKMPSNLRELNEIKRAFYQIAKFPNVIGALDCTHIKIESPGGPQAETFRNRKQFFSMNMQAICDANLCFQNIVARWPGSAHDSRIFRNSRIQQSFENREFGNGVLVVDSGYAVTSYCIAPLGRPSNPAEQLFNESQIRTRNPIERAFGVLKRRFPVLALGIRLSLDKVECICVAACVLHNIAIKMNDSRQPPVNAEVEQAILYTNNVPVEPLSTSNCNPHLRPFINYFNNIR